MTVDNKELIKRLLKGIETGDPASVAVVNEEKYIQHNPQTHEGSIGLAELFKQLAKTSPRVNIVRVFEDGDYVFAHTEYDFTDRNIGFEIFRFEDGQAVEHWDNIQRRKGPNASGHSMVDGMTDVSDTGITKDSRQLIQSFVDDVLIGKNMGSMTDYIDTINFVEHNPHSKDDIEALKQYMLCGIDYRLCHRILADGDFVLSVCEGSRDGVHTSFYDLYRLQDGKIVEHWDTSEAIPPRQEWKNDNGKF